MNEVKVIEETKAVTLQDAEFYKQEAIKWLTSTGNLQKFTENQKMQFIDICQAYGLNPIKKEVYGVPYGNNFNLIVGYESYIKRAERSERLDGWNVEVLGTGNDMKAVITIYRKDWTKPFKHEVYFEEYNTNQNLWKTKPRTMLKKVAIAQGFRMCFSEELGGMPYTREELPEEMSEPTPIEKDITPVKVSEETTEKNTKKPAPKYTKQQAVELGKIMNSLDSNNNPVFSDEEKQNYKKMLIDGYYEDAMRLSRETMVTRLQSQEPTAEEIESEIIY